MKNYLLKGYAIHAQFEQIEKKIQQHDQILIEHDQKFDLIIKTHLPPNEGIFYDGQIFDAYKFVIDIVKTAICSIILIDNYIDQSVLLLLSKRNKEVEVEIYTCEISEQLKLDLTRYNAQYPKIEVKKFTKSHDRFLIIDHQIPSTRDHIGASLKDLGKKWFAFSKIALDANEMIAQLMK